MSSRTFLRVPALLVPALIGLWAGEARATGAEDADDAQVSALVWSPVLGPLLDRLDRASALGVCMVLAAIGNFALIFLSTPLASHAWLFA
ncbi:MAG: hypothetical protein ACKN9P_14075, partial [Phenylobacterium sp.]